jgi:hypothetical protein
MPMTSLWGPTICNRNQISLAIDKNLFKRTFINYLGY